METKVITAHIPISLADQVDLLSNRLERSKAWIVKQALGAWIDQEEERYRLTLEAMVDVDNSDVIDHQSVEAWAKSLSTDSPLLTPR